MNIDDLDYVGTTCRVPIDADAEAGYYPHQGTFPKDANGCRNGNILMPGTLQRTLTVNLYGGPGTGKSRTMGHLFGALKDRHVRCEIAPEFAKELAYQKRFEQLAFQMCVSAEQAWRIFSLQGKVEVVITDSPILIGVGYGGIGCTRSWEEHVTQMHNALFNLDIFLVRDTKNVPYQRYGRHQNEDEARAADGAIRSVLDQRGVKYIEQPVLSQRKTAKAVRKHVMDALAAERERARNAEELLAESVGLDAGQFAGEFRDHWEATS